MKIVQKAFAYITHRNRLLVFEHPHHPEAGLQVPAGSVEEQEGCEAAVLREAWEETGLDGLTVVRFLGEQRRDMRAFGRQEIHERHFFHLAYTKTPPESWEHHELFGSDGDHHLFRFFWVELDAVPPLIAGHDAFLHELA